VMLIPRVFAAGLSSETMSCGEKRRPCWRGADSLLVDLTVVCGMSRPYRSGIAS